jgi:rhodanese-related sulfurtransferase
MAKTFMQMASEAVAAVPSVSPEEARRRLQDDPNTLLVDVRDLDMIRETGMAEGATPISNGALPLRADREVPESLRDERLQDRSRPVLTICGAGPMSAIGAKTLQDMGFERVAYVAGGTQAWQAAGLPTTQPGKD